MVVVVVVMTRRMETRRSKGEGEEEGGSKGGIDMNDVLFLFYLIFLEDRLLIWLICW